MTNLKNVNIMSDEKYSAATKNQDELYFTPADSYITSVMPDYSAGISVSVFPYTLSANGWIKAEIICNNREYGRKVFYTDPMGNKISFGSADLISGQYSNYQTVMFMVEKNGVLTRDSTASTMIFFPFKGVK